MNEQTLEKMRKLRLFGMHRALKTNLETDRNEKFTPDELISFLIDSEWDDRYNRSIDRSLKNAHFRYKAGIENIDYAPQRAIDKNQIHRFAECDFIKAKENILITGSTGTGKSFMASAIGHQACFSGYKVLYANTSKLFAQLKIAKADGSVMKELIRIEKQDLLILDDFGIQPLDQQSRSMLMEIMEDRHGKRSTIITSQLPVKLWYDVIGEKTVADAILDRIVHDAHRLDIKGESMRKKKEKRSEEKLD
jgi:DNA replication protein DnaC